MRPDYHSMIVTFLAFVVLPLALVGVAALVHKAHARGRRLFRDEPRARVDALKANLVSDHRQDALT